MRVVPSVSEFVVAIDVLAGSSISILQFDLTSAALPPSSGSTRGLPRDFLCSLVADSAEIRRLLAGCVGETSPSCWEGGSSCFADCIVVFVRSCKFG